MSNPTVSISALEVAEIDGDKKELKRLAQLAWSERYLSADMIADATGYSAKTIASWPRPVVVVEYDEVSEPVEPEPIEPAAVEAPVEVEVVKDTVKPFRGVAYKNANDARIARNGYLSALQDIAHALAEGGEDRVAQWIQDNGAGKVVLGVDFPA